MDNDVPDSKNRNKKKLKQEKQVTCSRSALAFYVKLYRSRTTKKISNPKYSNMLVEATQSWLSLSEDEKEKFTKEWKSKNLQLLGNYLQKAEPFMKKKSNKEIQEDSLETNITEEPKSVMNVEYDDNSIQTTEHKTKIDDNIIISKEIEETLLESNDIENMQIESNQLSKIFYSEPVPPSIKTGKELFQTLKSMDNDNDSTWDSLTNKDKSQYSRAVFMLKQDYIYKYRQYLENLSQRELFDYYNKTFH